MRGLSATLLALTGSDGSGQETSSKLQDRTIPRPLDAQQHLLEHIIRSQLGSVHQDRSHLQQDNSLVSVSYQTTMNPAGTGIATHSVRLPSTVKGQDTFILDDPVQSLETIPVHEPLSDGFCSIRRHSDQDDLYAASRHADFNAISFQCACDTFFSLRVRTHQPVHPTTQPSHLQQH
jgi:hypothetical protein